MVTNKQVLGGRKAKLDGHAYETLLAEQENIELKDGYVPDIFGGMTRSKQDAIELISGVPHSISIKKKAGAWQLQDSRFEKIIAMVEYHGGSKATKETHFVFTLFCGDNNGSMSIEDIYEFVGLKIPVDATERRQGRLKPATIKSHFPSQWEIFTDWLDTNSRILIKAAMTTGMCLDIEISHIRFEEHGLISVDKLMDKITGTSFLKTESAAMISLGPTINLQRKSGGGTKHSLLIRCSNAKLKKELYG